MINNLVKATGGLHNRLTGVLPLSPFTLLETKQFLESKALKLNLSSIIELYLAVGGVPHYLMQTERRRTVDSNIAARCFDRSGFLRDEFNQLFRSLFTNFSECEKIVRLLHAAKKGLTLDAIVKLGRMSKGGDYVKGCESWRMPVLLVSLSLLIAKVRIRGLDWPMSTAVFS